jgi:hypothetical protein
MRILILGAGGEHRTEAAIARAAAGLGHAVTVLDALGWRRRLGGLTPRFLRWKADRFAPDYVLCTRHAIAAGDPTVQTILAGRDSGFWYFDAALPLSPRVLTLGRLTARVFATYGYQVEAFREAGIPAALFLPQGVDPDFDQPAERIPESYRCDVSFVGSGPYPRRHQILRAIAAVCALQIRGPGWEHAGPGLPIAGGRVRGKAFAQVVRGAAISLGIDALPEQRREWLGGTSNRLWRVLGTGGLFLGERVGGIEAFARDGEHAVWYRDAEEAMERVTQLLADPDGRGRIAQAGRAHVLAQHTYRHRLSLLLAGRGYSST